MTCLIHKKTREKYNEDYQKKCENLKSNSFLRNYMFPGPWRYNNIYGFVSIEYDGGTRILGHRWLRHRNRKGLPYSKSGIFLHYDYSQTLIGNGTSNNFTNEQIIDAIKSILEQEGSFFRKKRKYLEYSMQIVKNTDWLTIINNWKNEVSKVGSR